MQKEYQERHLFERMEACNKMEKVHKKIKYPIIQKKEFMWK